MSEHVEEMATGIAAAMIADPAAPYKGWWNEPSLWTCVRMLAKLVRDAKPIVQSDATMMADISRHAPLPAESQLLFDSTKSSSELWLEEFERITK